MAYTDLVKLIDLSLGIEPQGVVNFNYLHKLLHEIVKRLLDFEALDLSTLSERLQDLEETARITPDFRSIPSTLKSSRKADSKPGLKPESELKYKLEYEPKPDSEPDSDSEPKSESERTKKSVSERRSESAGKRKSSEYSKRLESEGTRKSDSERRSESDKRSESEKKSESDKRSASDKRSEADKRSASDKRSEAEGTGKSESERRSGSESERQAESGHKSESEPKLRPSDSEQKSMPSLRSVQEQPDGYELETEPESDSEPKSRSKSKSKLSAVGEAEENAAGEDLPRVSSSRTTVSSKPMRLVSGSSKSRVKSRSSIASAANDLGVLEKKMQDLELRMNTMETLPELLERKSSDSGITPISDMWNFTNLNNRLNAAEEGMMKASRIVDELLGELQNLKSNAAKQNESGDRLSKRVYSELDSIQSKLKDLESLKLSAGHDGSMGDAATAMLTNLSSRIEEMQAEINNLKKGFSGMDLSKFATLSDLNEQDTMIQRHQSSLEAQNEVLSNLEKASSEFSESMAQVTGKVGEMEEDMLKIMGNCREIETSLGEKVNATDLMSLMPTGGGGGGDGSESASLLPKIIEMQTKLKHLESLVGGVPSDVQDRMSAMKKSISTLTDELSSLAASVNSLQAKSDMDNTGRIDELGSQLSQLKERVNDIDRAVTVAADFISSQSREPAQAGDEADGAKLADADALNEIQGLLSQMHEEQERLMGTAAHLSHEIDINKEHVKTLYDGMDNVKENKADKAQVEVEVREKADRRALETKASRDWVDSTFERLDKEIRDAMSQMTGQEENFKMAMDQLNQDVGSKLDRLEMEGIKDYFDKKLDRVKTAPKEVFRESTSDEAAGFKKPLNFRCISCDKPVSLKQLGIIPALPSVTTFPGTRSFRPYTTYELELIRRHQKIGYPIQVPNADLARSIRSAGGIHTKTRPFQRIRMAPFGTTPHTPENYSQPVARKSSPRPLTNDEMDIVGQDGHVYKGRNARSRSRLPPLQKFKRKTSTRQTPVAQTTPTF